MSKKLLWQRVFYARSKLVEYTSSLWFQITFQFYLAETAYRDVLYFDSTQKFHISIYIYIYIYIYMG